MVMAVVFISMMVVHIPVALSSDVERNQLTAPCDDSGYCESDPASLLQTKFKVEQTSNKVNHTMSGLYEVVENGTCAMPVESVDECATAATDLLPVVTRIVLANRRRGGFPPPDMRFPHIRTINTLKAPWGCGVIPDGMEQILFNSAAHIEASFAAAAPEFLLQQQHQQQQNRQLNCGPIEGTQGSWSCICRKASAWPCSTGIRSGDVCCASSCGSCGGTGCGSRPGGSKKCCTGKIKTAAQACSGPSDDGCIIKEAAALWWWDDPTTITVPEARMQGEIEQLKEQMKYVLDKEP